MSMVHGETITRLLRWWSHKAAAEAEASVEYSDHVDWIDGVEVILSHMELADNPPALGLNQAQLLLG